MFHNGQFLNIKCIRRHCQTSLFVLHCGTPLSIIICGQQLKSYEDKTRGNTHKTLHRSSILNITALKIIKKQSIWETFQVLFWLFSCCGPFSFQDKVFCCCFAKFWISFPFKKAIKNFLKRWKNKKFHSKIRNIMIYSRNQSKMTQVQKEGHSNTSCSHPIKIPLKKLWKTWKYFKIFS